MRRVEVDHGSFWVGAVVADSEMTDGNKMYFSKVNDPAVWESERYFVFSKHGDTNPADELLTEFNRLKALAEWAEVKGRATLCMVVAHCCAHETVNPQHIIDTCEKALAALPKDTGNA